MPALVPPVHHLQRCHRPQPSYRCRHQPRHLWLPHHLRMRVIAALPLPNRGPLLQRAPLSSRVKFLEQTSCGENKPAETGAPRSTCVLLLEFRSTHDSDFNSSNCQTSGQHLPNTNYQLKKTKVEKKSKKRNRKWTP
ncbi:hypothetical protein GE061_008946 [Apolygus lucorum]|uniref:Uncharacterized protein n=1 Tax=Apolygus lucorum TaxID=248454 RepID=A0A8S9XZ57_APOLU|nr:hypothetical protein GE061_008946 [Apolygus lucorum]